MVVNLFEDLVRVDIIDDAGEDGEGTLAWAVNSKMVEPSTMVVVERKHVICGVFQVETLDSVLETFAKIGEEWVGSNAQLYPDGFGGGWYISDGNEGVPTIIGFAVWVRGRREGGVTGTARKGIAIVTLVLVCFQILAIIGLDKSHFVWIALIVPLAFKDMPNCAKKEISRVFCETKRGAIPKRPCPGKNSSYLILVRFSTK